MLPHLINLPTEILELILTNVCYENAQTIQACRQVCRKLNAVITQSKLVQYLERVALLGMYDPLLLVDCGASFETLSLSDRAAALRAWEESWNSLAGTSHDGNAKVFWQERAPDLQIALPPGPLISWQPSSQVRYMLATMIDPEPGPEQEENWLDGFIDIDKFSLRDWFITTMRHGLGIFPSYSYLDLRGCLAGVEGRWGEERAPGGIQVSEDENEDRDQGDDDDYVYWTCIKIPVWNVVALALSAELDLAVVISATFEDQHQEGEMWNTHLAVRPLRLRDGTPHPHANVPTMRLSVKHNLVFSVTHVQVLGDYLLFWIGPDDLGLGDYGVGRIYLIAWKQGLITLLRECPVGKYGTVHMISDDVLVLVQRDPPGIELCRVSNIKKEAEEENGSDGGATNGQGSTNDEPRMEKLCTLLLPPLLQPRDLTGFPARVISAVCVGEHPGHQAFSRGPWKEHRCAPLGRCQLFRQSTKDSILGIELEICRFGGHVHAFEVVVRCATLLAYAEGAYVVPNATSTVAADPESSNGDRDGQLTFVRAVVGDANADNDVEGVNDGGVPWDTWGPQATAVSERGPAGWRHSLGEQVGERRATVEWNTGQIRIRDYNPYRIRQARGSMMAKGLRGHAGHGWGDSHEEDEDEGERNADTFHPKVTRRIIERSTIQGGEWSEEDLTTELPHLETNVNVPGCRAIYMEQDKVMLYVDDIGQITGRPNRMNGQPVDGFVLYNM